MQVQKAVLVCIEEKDLSVGAPGYFQAGTVKLLLDPDAISIIKENGYGDVQAIVQMEPGKYIHVPLRISHDYRTDVVTFEVAQYNAPLFAIDLGTYHALGKALQEV